MRFTEAPGVCGLAIFAYLSTITAALTLRVHQDRVNGTAGQSVLLPVSYTVPDPHGYLRITWTRAGNVLAKYTCFFVQHCKTGQSRPFISVSSDFKHRVQLFPENASLLLSDLRINDSGIYELAISHSTGTGKRNLTLLVWPDAGNGKETVGTEEKKMPAIANIRYVSLILIFIFLGFTVKTHRGRGRSQEEAEKGNAPQADWFGFEIPKPAVFLAAVSNSLSSQDVSCGVPAPTVTELTPCGDGVPSL